MKIMICLLKVKMEFLANKVSIRGIWNKPRIASRVKMVQIKNHWPLKTSGTRNKPQRDVERRM